MLGELTQSFHKLYPLSDPVDYEPAAADSIAGHRHGHRAGGRPRWPTTCCSSDDGNQLLYMPLMNYVAGNLDDVREMLLSPHAIMGLSDGGAHCGAICDASFPTTTLAHWGRRRTRGEKLPVELLVHHLTQRTAAPRRLARPRRAWRPATSPT